MIFVHALNDLAIIDLIVKSAHPAEFPMIDSSTYFIRLSN